MCAKVIEMEENDTIECDNLECDYETLIPQELIETMIDKPCPKCGENLLTQEDYEDSREVVEAMKTMVDVINSMSEEELEEMTKDIELPEGVNKDDIVSLGVKSHKGKLDMITKIIKKAE